MRVVAKSMDDNWELSNEYADRVVQLCKEGGVVPLKILEKTISNILKRSGGGVLINQTFDEVQQDLDLSPEQLGALVSGRSVMVTREQMFSDRSDVMVQECIIRPRRNSRRAWLLFNNIIWDNLK